LGSSQREFSYTANNQEEHATHIVGGARRAAGALFSRLVVVELPARREDDSGVVRGS
jgi:hypothetical protein